MIINCHPPTKEGKILFRAFLDVSAKRRTYSPCSDLFALSKLSFHCLALPCLSHSRTSTSTSTSKPASRPTSVHDPLARLLLAELCRLQLVKEALNATGEPYDLAIRTHRTLDDCVYVRKQVYRLDQAVLDSANVSLTQTPVHDNALPEHIQI
jgi:hypothetical protein